MSLFKIDCCYKHKCQHLVFNEADRYQWNDAGENHSPCHHVTMMMAVGWVTFLLSYVVNVAFYMIHPSGVDINRSRFRNKWYFYINGRRVNLSFKRNEVLEKRNEEILLSPSVTSSSFDSSTSKLSTENGFTNFIV